MLVNPLLPHAGIHHHKKLFDAHTHTCARATHDGPKSCLERLETRESKITVTVNAEIAKLT